MSKDYLIRQYQPGDEEGIVQLLELVFHGWPPLDLSCSALDFWRWKYLDNPMKRSTIIVCVYDKRVIGCMHSIPIRIKMGDDVVLGATTLDYVVHPEYRRLGISTEIRSMHDTNATKGGMKIQYAITGNPILVKSISKFLPRFPSLLVNMVRIRDVDKQLRFIPMERAWLKKIGFHAMKLITYLRTIGISHEPSDKDLIISEISNFDERINEFWNVVSNHYDFIVERRRNYLNWRYCDPRAGDFIIKQVEEDGRVIGYSVLRINRFRSDYPVGFIVDLLTLPDRLDVADALLADAVQYFEDNDINIVNYQTVKSHPYERVLQRHGFIDSRINIHLFCNPSGITREELDEIMKSPASRIFISWGDHDVLPVKMPKYT